MHGLARVNAWLLGTAVAALMILNPAPPRAFAASLPDSSPALPAVACTGVAAPEGVGHAAVTPAPARGKPVSPLRPDQLTAAVAPAVAAPHWHFDRRLVIARAYRWARMGVPYSQVRHLDGYRTDCSGFVSMAWGVPENLTTWRIPFVAKRIGKSQLLPGDVLLDIVSPPGGRHVVMFVKWANARHTAYTDLEETGQRGVHRAILRTVPYPYRVNQHRYLPYRFVSMRGYWGHVTRSDWQPVAGYRGAWVHPGMGLLRAGSQAETKEVSGTAWAPTKAAENRPAVVVGRRPDVLSAVLTSTTFTTKRILRAAGALAQGVDKAIIAPIVGRGVPRSAAPTE